jgi:hypothetical protein
MKNGRVHHHGNVQIFCAQCKSGLTFLYRAGHPYDTCRVGQNHIYIRCIYGIFGREFTKYTVIYGVFIRFWPPIWYVHIVCVCVCIWQANMGTSVTDGVTEQSWPTHANSAHESLFLHCRTIPHCMSVCCFAGQFLITRERCTWEFVLHCRTAPHCMLFCRTVPHHTWTVHMMICVTLQDSSSWYVNMHMRVCICTAGQFLMIREHAHESLFALQGSSSSHVNMHMIICVTLQDSSSWYVNMHMRICVTLQDSSSWYVNMHMRICVTLQDSSSLYVVLQDSSSSHVNGAHESLSLHCRTVPHDTWTVHMRVCLHCSTVPHDTWTCTWEFVCTAGQFLTNVNGAHALLFVGHFLVRCLLHEVLYGRNALEWCTRK